MRPGSRVLLLAPAPALAPYVHAIALRRPDPEAPALPAAQGFPAQWRSALTLVSEGALIDADRGRVLGAAEFSGPRLQPGWRSYRGAPVVTTVLFRPGTLAAWLGGDQLPVADERRPARALLPRPVAEELNGVIRAGDSLARQVWSLECWLMRQLAGRPRAEPTLPPEGVRDVQTWAERLGCSPRQLQRRVHAQTRLSPKAWLRLLRLEDCMRRLHQTEAAAMDPLARDTGYSDGAHMARELRALAGLSPRALRRLLQSQDPRPWLMDPAPSA